MSDMAKLKIEYLLEYCKEKGYQIEEIEENKKKRFYVSNGVERVNVDIYNTGAFVPGGSTRSTLRKEFDDLKIKLDNRPEIILQEIKQKKSISVKYDILEKERGEKILEAIKSEGLNIEMDISKQITQIFRGKIESCNSSVVLTHYTNGTLLLQGKKNDLFDKVCTIVEKILLPAEKDVALRFISNDERTMEEFISIYTPKILETADKSIRDLLGTSFEFLEEHDRKYLVASECLVLAKLNLPEYSPIVMPAAKAFEGFAKKLVVKIGLFPNNHFSKKDANFAILYDKKHSNRDNLIAKEKHAGSYLDKLANSLDMSRNFMMHSDESEVTKVNSHDEAIEKQREICKSIKELFEYFNRFEFGGLL